MLEILDLESRGTIHELKTKVLLDFEVTMKLICVFVYAYVCKMLVFSWHGSN